VDPGRVHAVQAIFGVRDQNRLGWFGEGRLEPPNVLLDLRVLQDVAVDLRQSRVAVGDPTQEDDELQQIGVRLLPERFLRLAQQVVEQRGDRIGHCIRIEIVVQGVVADAAVDADLHVVRLATGTGQGFPRT
jgi:hypothetical protein